MVFIPNIKILLFKDKLNKKASLLMSLTGLLMNFCPNFCSFLALAIYLSMFMVPNFCSLLALVFFKLYEKFVWRFFEVVSRPSGALKISFVVSSNIGVYSIRILL